MRPVPAAPRRAESTRARVSGRGYDLDLDPDPDLDRDLDLDLDLDRDRDSRVPRGKLPQVRRSSSSADAGTIGLA